ncbi:hypothetical protein L3V82_12495 [Thiotrichales bacterium 19S3-7]|nr:hypothetical protein [Thiotrichales bacterium 19S3-7]MCF6803010.1 hypothetical protein [Thiotrichales bacterium 19S3-11]
MKNKIIIVSLNVIISLIFSISMGFGDEIYSNKLEGYKINVVYVNDQKGEIYAGSDDGLFISKDLGNSWILKTVDDGLSSNIIKDIAASGDNIYIIDNGYADVSYDGGQSWQSLNDKYKGYYQNVGYGDNRLYLFAAYDNESEDVSDSAFLLESNNQGLTWRQINWPTNVYPIVCPRHLFVSQSYVGFVDVYFSTAWLSTDDGNTWNFTIPRDNNSGNVPTLNGIYINNNKVTLSTSLGVGYTDQINEIWNPFTFIFGSSGLASTNVTMSFVDKHGKIFAATKGGLGVSAPEQPSDNIRYTNYIKSNLDQLSSSVVNDIDEFNNIIIVATDNGLSYYLNNNQLSYSKVQTEASDEVTSVAANDNGIYFGGYGAKFTCTSTDGCQMQTGAVIPYNSQVNTGHGVTLLADGVYQAITYTGNTNGISSNQVTSVFADGNHLYVGSVAGLDISTDNGKSWVYKGKNEGLASYYVTQVVAADQHIYAGIYAKGLSISDDSGASWHTVNHSNGLSGSDDVIYSLFAQGNKVYVGTYKGGLSFSSDNGNTWQHFLDNKTIYAIFAMSNSIYVGTEEGVYISVDSGKSWTLKTNGLDAQTVTSIYVSLGNIYAGLANGNVAVSFDGGNFSVDDNL